MKRSGAVASVPCRYTAVAASFGEVFVAAGPGGLLEIALDGFEDAFLARLRRLYGPDVRRDDRGLAGVRRALRAYFDGRATTFALETDLSRLRPFQRRVLEALGRVPYGEVISYGELARRAGKPQAARAVGQAVGANPLPLVYPCHRVIAGDGTIGGFGGGLQVKRALLALEGVEVPERGGGLKSKKKSPARARPAARRAAGEAPRAARSARSRARRPTRSPHP